MSELRPDLDWIQLQILRGANLPKTMLIWVGYAKKLGPHKTILKNAAYFKKPYLTKNLIFVNGLYHLDDKFVATVDAMFLDHLNSGGHSGGGGYGPHSQNGGIRFDEHRNVQRKAIPLRKFGVKALQDMKNQHLNASGELRVTKPRDYPPKIRCFVITAQTQKTLVF